jgi:hypothetical protein
MNLLRFARGVYDVHFARDLSVELSVEIIKLFQITQGDLVVTRLTAPTNVKIALIWRLV